MSARLQSPRSSDPGDPLRTFLRRDTAIHGAAPAASMGELSARPTPPKPSARPAHVTLWRHLKLFRDDILSAQPARLYRARMAEFRVPFLRSFLINQTDLVRLVLRDRPEDFPKSGRLREGLVPLLGDSVFLTNGPVWKRQRRIIDPAFAGGRLGQSFPAMVASARAMVARMEARSDGRAVEIEQEASYAAADVIFRTLFSVPIENELAAEVFGAFRTYQRAQPLLNIAALLPLPAWMPRLHRRHTRASARKIRLLIRPLVERRLAEIRAGRAPDDLATKIMTMRDPETGQRFGVPEVVDQVAVFFLAGHETSAAALSWGLFLLAQNPDVQARVAREARALPERPSMPDLARLAFTRDVFREVLRLYPPVPMMVREATRPERFRDRAVPVGAQIVISPWHLHRHARLWDRPDAFLPERWSEEAGKTSARAAYLPFSAGPRVCTGAGFAMAEGVLLLALMVRAFEVGVAPGRPLPTPVAHLTLRARDGIWLTLAPRS